jgi:hypothetical protein
MRNQAIEGYVTATVDQVIQASARSDVHDALRQIRETAHFAAAQALQVLALRRYLRMQNKQHVNLHRRWAWTPEQAREHASAGSGQLLMGEAARAQQEFAKNNPGYSLAISPLRSLERQVGLWNGNLKVRAAAAGLFRELLKKVADDEFKLPITHKKVADLALWLQERDVHPEPTSAAPGTSDHGQLRAVDFVVVHGGKVIAGTNSDRIAVEWTGPGWTKKLVEAASSTTLIGPLANPYEPWHWRIA